MTQANTDAIVLCWNELEIAKDSVRLLLKEPTVRQVILVDNGSSDGSREYFLGIEDERITVVALHKNQGSSVGRNEGLKVTTAPYVFLIDGDILYVRGTIAEYEKIIKLYPDAACVGQHNHQHLQDSGHNGVLDIGLADTKMEQDYTIEDWFPMAWTQYGLFDGALLREIKFETTPPFNEAGYGFEDDILFHQFEERGKSSLSVTKPTYYHHAHSGWRELGKANVPDRFKEREAFFRGKYGATWAERVNEINAFTTRDNPESAEPRKG